MESDPRTDRVFFALSHVARRRMLDLLVASPGMAVNAVSSHFEMSRIAVMKHLQVLEEAELVISKKQGRTRHLYPNLVPIQMIYDRWSSEYSSFWAERMLDIKSRVEQKSQGKNKHA